MLKEQFLSFSSKYLPLNFLKFQNETMLTEGELSMVEDSDSVRDLQDRIGELKAEVNSTFF